jgi:two-component system, chemotaxis family, chemotaxis protein CheY
MARILVVDDDSVIRDMLAMVLAEESDHDVIVAANGQEALDQLHDGPVDAIVCDVNMPVMDGIELVRTVRSDPDLNDVPVLLISADLAPDNVDPDLEVDLMLEKPFEINALLACVGFVLDGVRAGRRQVRVTRRRAASGVRRLMGDPQRRPGYGGTIAH